MIPPVAASPKITVGPDTIDVSLSGKSVGARFSALFAPVDMEVSGHPAIDPAHADVHTVDGDGSVLPHEGGKFLPDGLSALSEPLLTTPAIVGTGNTHPANDAAIASPLVEAAKPRRPMDPGMHLPIARPIVQSVSAPSEGNVEGNPNIGPNPASGGNLVPTGHPPMHTTFAELRPRSDPLSADISPTPSPARAPTGSPPSDPVSVEPATDRVDPRITVTLGERGQKHESQMQGGIPAAASLAKSLSDTPGRLVTIQTMAPVETTGAADTIVRPALAPQALAGTPNPAAPPTVKGAPLQPLSDLVERIAQSREAAMPHRAEISVQHREFGTVSIRMDAAATGGALSFALTSQDAGFAPAAHSALAERVAAERGAAASSVAGTTREDAANTNGQANTGFAAQSGHHGSRENTQGGRPATGQAPDRHAAAEDETAAPRGMARDRDLFA